MGWWKVVMDKMDILTVKFLQRELLCLSYKAEYHNPRDQVERSVEAN